MFKWAKLFGDFTIQALSILVVMNEVFTFDRSVFKPSKANKLPLFNLKQFIFLTQFLNWDQSEKICPMHYQNTLNITQLKCNYIDL